MGEKELKYPIDYGDSSCCYLTDIEHYAWIDTQCTDEGLFCIVKKAQGVFKNFRAAVEGQSIHV